MNTLLWILQGLLAAAFLTAGILKSTQPREKLAPKLPWVQDFSPATVRFIGIAELLGGIGLIVPQLTGIAAILTPLAAAALAVVMILAAVYHARRHESSGIVVNAVLFALLAVIAWGRFTTLAGI